MIFSTASIPAFLTCCSNLFRRSSRPLVIRDRRPYIRPRSDTSAHTILTLGGIQRTLCPIQIQQVLELFHHERLVLCDQSLFTHVSELSIYQPNVRLPERLAAYILPRRIMQIHVDPLHLFIQPALCLAHVIRDRVVLHKSGRFGSVVLFRRDQEWSLEKLVVDRQDLSLGIRLVDTEQDCQSQLTPSESRHGKTSLP